MLCTSCELGHLDNSTRETVFITLPNRREVENTARLLFLTKQGPISLGERKGQDDDGGGGGGGGGGDDSSRIARCLEN